MDKIAHLIWSIVGAFIAILNLLCLIFLFRHKTSLLVKGMFHHLVAVCACDILVGIALAVETSPFVKPFKENIYICVGSLMFFCLAQILSHTSVFGLILRRFIVIRNLHSKTPSYGWNKKYIIIMLAKSVTVLATSFGAFIYLLPPESTILKLECVVPVIYMDNARKLYGVIFFWLMTFLLGSNILCFLCIKRLKRELKLRFSAAEQNENQPNSLGLTEHQSLPSDLNNVNQSEVNLHLGNFKDKRVLENILEGIPFEQQHKLGRADSIGQDSPRISSSARDLTRFQDSNTHNSSEERKHVFCKALKTGGESFDTTCCNVYCNESESSYRESTGFLEYSSPDHERENGDKPKKVDQHTSAYSLLNSHDASVNSGELTDNYIEPINCNSVYPLETVDTLQTEGRLEKSTERASRAIRRSRPFIAKAEKKALVTLSVVVILLNLSTGPTVVIVIIMALGGDINVVTGAIVGYSMCLNSFFNTMVYVLRIQSLRERICEGRRIQEVEEVDASTQT